MKDQNNTQKHVYICSPLRPVSTNPILRANELIDNLKLAKDCEQAERTEYPDEKRLSVDF